jgi:hypothetical protein|tara:strand:+ start:763 stop:942 length:180 start_codon:yes stop_codon:yes gene_type:complete
MAKKVAYKGQEVDEKELQEFREHSKMIDEKSKVIIEKYRKWWDKDKGTWKKGFKEHGNS